MLRSFRTWAPNSDEKWFFDKSVWQKMFRAMGGCGLDALILHNVRLFDDEGSDFADMRHWILKSAPDYNITPYLAIDPKKEFASFGSSIEKANEAFRDILATYPEVRGLFVKLDDDAEFVQRVIVDAMDAVRPDAPLYMEVSGEPDSRAQTIRRRANRPIRFVVEYTQRCLVDSNPDPRFSAWIEAVGAEKVAAEIAAANFAPWTCFSYDTADEIASGIREMGCDGLVINPLSSEEWPNTSDTFFKLQWQRDLVWYNVWGGTNAQQLARQGAPKWLARNRRLIPGFEAGSRIIELITLYFAGDKRGSWRPQFCSVCDNDKSRLFTIEDMLDFDDMDAFSGRDWWEEITGDTVVHLREYIESGTPEDAYGPEELIAELNDLAEQAAAAGEKGLRNNSGEKELPSFSRDALCMGRLGEFYVERIRAALSHARGDDAEAAEHLKRALGLYREIAEVDSSHRAGIDWTSFVNALEMEQTDAAKGIWARGSEYTL